MDLLTLSWWSVVTITVFGLIETVTLGALVACDLVGTTCGARLPAGEPASGAEPGAKLACAGFLLGQVFVGVATPYLVLMLMAPRSDWLVGLARTMVLASGGFGVSALLVTFLASVLARRPSRVAAHEQTEFQGPANVSQHQVGAVDFGPEAGFDLDASRPAWYHH